MRKSVLRRCSAVVAAGALCLSLGLASADAAPTASPQQAAAEQPKPGVYLSPWGDAQVDLSDEILAWMEREGVNLEAIAPFRMDQDGKGFDMPIGSTAGDHLDAKGRIFYPGGLRFHHGGSGHDVTLKPTWIRVMPRPGYSAGVSIDGQRVQEEVQVADTHAEEVLAGARPSPTGWRLEKVPFYITKEMSELFEKHTGRPGPRPGSLLGTLTPNFDYVPTNDSQRPSFPGLPG